MAEDRTVTIRELWTQTTAAVGARNEARWLCEVATGLDGDAFVYGLDQKATQPMSRASIAAIAVVYALQVPLVTIETVETLRKGEK